MFFWSVCDFEKWNSTFLFSIFLIEYKRTKTRKKKVRKNVGSTYYYFIRFYFFLSSSSFSFLTPKKIQWSNPVILTCVYPQLHDHPKHTHTKSDSISIYHHISKVKYSFWSSNFGVCFILVLKLFFNSVLKLSHLFCFNP